MEEQIKRRAYELWQADGSPQGQDQGYWFKAVNEVATAGVAAIKPPRKRATKARKAA